jgi:hypothetical protein
VNSIDYLAAAAALFDVWTFDRLIPLLSLVVMMFVTGYLLLLASQKPDFAIEQMFKDDANKVSASRIIAFMAFNFTSWDLMSARLSGAVDSRQYLYYLLAWSGALVFVKLADRWNGQLPFVGGKQDG